MKNGFQQGELFQKAIVKAQGKKFSERLQNFFDVLPIFVIHPYFLAMHAGPIRNGSTRDELINIRSYVDFHWQLTWNRINETNSTPSKKEYSPDDLEILRYLLKQPPEMPIIVGTQPNVEVGRECLSLGESFDCKESCYFIQFKRRQSCLYKLY